MWDEIGQKNTKMYELQDENYELKQHNKKMADALRKVIKQKKEDAVYEKEILDFCQINRTDN